MRRIATKLLQCLASLWLIGVEGRSSLLRKENRGHELEAGAIGRHRALLSNTRRNSHDDSMSRIRIRNRLTVGPNNFGSSGWNPKFTTSYTTGGESPGIGVYFMPKKKSSAITETLYYEDDDFFKYEAVDDAYIYYGCESSSKGASKSKGEDTSSYEDAGVFFIYSHDDDYEYRDRTGSKSKAKSKGKSKSKSKSKSACRRKKEKFKLPRVPTPAPAPLPTSSPTLSVAPSTSFAPTGAPSVSPTNAPTESPSVPPTGVPSSPPTQGPTNSPTTSPTRNPTVSPTNSPTKTPTTSPTQAPTMSPTAAPTKSPTTSPTMGPTNQPTTSGPTQSPSSSPTAGPTASLAPTELPSISPTITPTVSLDALEAERQEGGGGIHDAVDFEVDDAFLAPTSRSKSKSKSKSKGKMISKSKGVMSKTKGSSSRREQPTLQMMMLMMKKTNQFFAKSRDLPFDTRGGGDPPKFPGSSPPADSSTTELPTTEMTSVSTLADGLAPEPAPGGTANANDASVAPTLEGQTFAPTIAGVTPESIAPRTQTTGMDTERPTTDVKVRAGSFDVSLEPIYFPS